MRRPILLLFTLFALSLSLQAQNQVVDSSRVIRVLSFNILHGATTKGDFNLDVIAKVIQDSNPDFVALQEVDFKTNRAKKYDLVTELGWRTKMAPLYGRAMYYDGGEYGEGVLSKHTFLQTRNVALPFIPGDEPRAALEATTILPSKDTISFIGTHLDHLKTDSNRVMQAEKINGVFKNNAYPTILAGDLNAEPNSRPMHILEELWQASYKQDTLRYTYPSDEPRKKIDYVMFYPQNRWRVLETSIIQDSIASDHCAYLVVLELLEK